MDEYLHTDISKDFIINRSCVQLYYKESVHNSSVIISELHPHVTIQCIYKTGPHIVVKQAKLLGRS